MWNLCFKIIQLCRVSILWTSFNDTMVPTTLDRSSFRNTWDVRHEEKDFIRHKANMTVKGRSFVEYGRLFKVLKRQSPETKTPKFRGLKLSESWSVKASKFPKPAGSPNLVSYDPPLRETGNNFSLFGSYAFEKIREYSMTVTITHANFVTRELNNAMMYGDVHLPSSNLSYSIAKPLNCNNC